MTSPATLARRIYSVSEFSSSLSAELAEKFPSICVRGEVTNLSKPGSGHWYFSLKDQDAQIRSVMFRFSNLRSHQIKEGEEIIACGKPGVYKDRGDLQLVVSHIQLAGAGDLQKQFEDLKKELQEKGLFNRDSKQPIPAHPQRVAVITSSSGAVIHDIQTVTARRAPILPLLLLPTSVQGKESIQSIVDSIVTADAHPDIDLLLLARGGGSLEDFAAFNSREVAMAIQACKTPLMCSVGHESDISIADLVADVRAATPSEAAEIMTEGYAALSQQLQSIKRSLKQSATNRIATLDRDLRLVGNRLENPAQRIERAIQRLDSLEPLLASKASLLIQRKTQQLLQSSKSLNISSLRGLSEQKKLRLNEQSRRLFDAKSALLKSKQQRFQSNVQLLDTLSPLAVLARGYGITTDANGKIISSVEATGLGQSIRTSLQDGSIDAKVIHIEKAK